MRFTTDPDRMLADNILSQDQCDKLLELAKVGYRRFTVIIVLNLNVFARTEIMSSQHAVWSEISKDVRCLAVQKIERGEYSKNTHA